MLQRYFATKMAECHKVFASQSFLDLKHNVNPRLINPDHFHTLKLSNYKLGTPASRTPSRKLKEEFSPFRYSKLPSFWIDRFPRSQTLFQHCRRWRKHRMRDLPCCCIQSLLKRQHLVKLTGPTVPTCLGRGSSLVQQDFGPLNSRWKPCGNEPWHWKKLLFTDYKRYSSIFPLKPQLTEIVHYQVWFPEGPTMRPYRIKSMRCLWGKDGSFHGI